mgnify:CR=1 FL=1
MKKSEEILEKHIVLNDCIGYLGSDGRLYKAIIDALNEAIDYTHSCKSDSKQLPKRKRECNCSGMSDKVKCGFKCYD